MAAKTKKRAAKQIEWVGGSVRLPSYVTGEGEPYRPAAVVWLSPQGVLGMEVFGREYEPDQIVASFEATTRKPLVGRPHAPDRVRIASPDLAATLRAAVAPDIEVISAPTPELDVLMAALAEHLAEATDEDEDEEATYFTPGLTADALASFFRAAARLYRAAPWRVVPDDSCLIGVTVEALGVRDAVVSIVGRLGESHGFLCFSSLADYEAFLDAAEAMEDGDPTPKLPAHIALNFDRGADVPESQRKEIAAHGWEVAGANAYPWLAPVDEDAVFRPPTQADMTRIEAIAGAIARLVESEPDLARAWDRTEPLIRAFSVETSAGPVEVALAVQQAAVELDDVPFDVRAPLFDAAGELDEDFFEAYKDELLDRFAASPEAQDLPSGVDHSDLLLEHAAQHLGLTPANLTPSALREIVFEIIPAKLVCKPDIAGAIITELRAFFAFLGREFALPNAEPCRAVLGGDAALRLEQALSDPRNFGMGKSLIMAGEKAGFDVFTEEGLQAWMREVQKRPPRPVPAKPAAQGRAKKEQRKAEGQARKKNR